MAQNTSKYTPQKRRDNTHGEQNIGISILKWFGASIGTLLMVILVTGVMFACIFVVYCQNYLADTAIDVSVEDLTLNETSYIYYYDKDSGQYEVLDTLFIENRTWVSYEELPEYVFNALVAIEDHRFWDHHGVDWYRTIGAAYNIFLGDGSTFGGSTITQQVIKNTTGKDEVTVRRKLTEIFSALQFDKKYGKETTLEVYINLVYFGQGCHGIEAAAQTYFGKHASELSLAEAASIVGITNLPTYYDPYQNRDNNKTRQETILYAMKNYGYISDEEYRAAKAEKLVFKRDVQSSESGTTNKKVQSYFVDQVIEDVIEDLMEQRGVSRKIASTYLYTGGYKIYVTMDTDVQAAIDEVYTNPDYWPALADADELEQPPQSAIVVVDNSSGKVLGMYGGLGEKTGDRVRNRATQMTKQPGSSIKPLAVYAPALEAGLLNPSSVMTDMPAMLDGAKKPYPKNYDRVYRGQMTIMEAVQRSNNTIPVQLVRTMGPERCFEFAKYKMGLSTLVEGEYRGDSYFSDAQIASMALGGLTDGVTVEEMAAAYAVFPNAGVYNEPYTYTKVEDSSGNIILEHSDEGTAVISERTAFYMNNMLQNVITHGTGVYARLENSMPAGGKTGTTDDDYDRWFVGYTPYYSCAVWYGFDYNHQIKTVSNTSPAVPLWKAVMDKLHENLEKKEFFTPENEEIVKVGYCRDSGLLASDACRADTRGSRVLTGTFYASDVPHEVCSVHRFVDVCGESGQLATDNCPAETRTQVAMMDLDRRFDVTVTLDDEQYTVKLPGVDYTQPDENGLYRAISAPNKDGTPLKNEFCTLHGGEDNPDDPNDDPSVTEFPTEPDDPNVSPDPNASTEPSTEPSDEPSEPPIEDYPSESPSPPPEFPTEPDDEPSEEPQP